MKLEVTMKEMQELMNKKGQLEIMGKSYILNPQDELLVKFIMDFKERHQTDYYDILSNAFNDILMRESMATNKFYQMVVNPMVNPYQQAPAPQMSYNDMKNMYKNQFAQQLGLNINANKNDEDPTYDPCDCHVCDGNCEANLPEENKNGIDEDDYKAIKSFLNEDGNLEEDRWCNDCVAMGIECDDNCDKHHEDFERIKSMSYKLGYKDAKDDNEKSKVKTEAKHPVSRMVTEENAKATMGKEVDSKVEACKVDVKTMDQPQPKKTSDLVQKILASKVVKTNDDK